MLLGLDWAESVARKYLRSSLLLCTVVMQIVASFLQILSRQRLKKDFQTQRSVGKYTLAHLFVS